MEIEHSDYIKLLNDAAFYAEKYMMLMPEGRGTAPFLIKKDVAKLREVAVAVKERVLSVNY